MIYGRLYGMKTTVLRISIPYGPLHLGGGGNYGIAAKFIKAAVNKEKITVFGEGSQKRDYLYIDDLVHAFILAAYKEQSRGKIYNIGYSSAVSLFELVELIIETAGGGEVVKVPWPDEYQVIETGDYLSCIELAGEELGWSPVTNLREGISRTVGFYKTL